MVNLELLKEVDTLGLLLIILLLLLLVECLNSLRNCKLDANELTFSVNMGILSWKTGIKKLNILLLNLFSYLHYLRTFFLSW